MCRDDELGVRKLCFQKLAELIAVARIDGHDDVVQERQRETIAKEALHERKIETHSHAVLVAFAVVGSGREQASFVEIHIETKLALAGR